MPLFNTDFDGVLRPQGVAWDIGALEFIFDNPQPVTPTISIISPNGGERLKTGRWKSFYWNSTNLPESSTIKIELSRNNGSSYQFLFNTFNSGSANWWVVGPSSSTCILKLSSVEYPDVFDVSDRTFRVM